MDWEKDLIDFWNPRTHEIPEDIFSKLFNSIEEAIDYILRLWEWLTKYFEEKVQRILEKK